MKKSLSLLLLVALAACNGDSTGSRPSLAGQWIFRMRAGTVESLPAGCQVVGYVRLTGSGSSFSGRMPLAEASCLGPYNIAASFDSTTTLTARVEGDSVFLTVQAGEYTITQPAQVLGDSLYGSTSDQSTRISARRYPDSVPLDRATVRMTGAVTREVELHGYGLWNGLRLISLVRDEAVLVLPASGAVPVLAVGTYAVGSPGASLGGNYERWAGNKVDPYVQFTGGTVTVTGADAQLVSGTLDVTGTLNGGSEQVRLQADFTLHRSGGI